MATKLIGKNALICGDSRTITVTFPYDITGHTIFFTVRASTTLDDSDDSTALIQKTVSSHSNPTAGETQIALSNTDTRITPGTHYFDIQDKDGSGNVASTKKAFIEFVEDVTKRTS